MFRILICVLRVPPLPPLWGNFILKCYWEIYLFLCLSGQTFRCHHVHMWAPIWRFAFCTFLTSCLKIVLSTCLLFTLLIKGGVWMLSGKVICLLFIQATVFWFVSLSLCKNVSTKCSQNPYLTSPAPWTVSYETIHRRLNVWRPLRGGIFGNWLSEPNVDCATAFRTEFTQACAETLRWEVCFCLSLICPN